MLLVSMLEASSQGDGPDEATIREEDGKELETVRKPVWLEHTRDRTVGQNEACNTA